MWVPGHSGVPGNATADFLAGSGPSGPRYSTKVPLADTRRWVKSTIRQTWQTEWANSRGAYLQKIKRSTDAWTDLRSMKDQKIISRLRTGNTRLSHNYEGNPFHRTCVVCNTGNTVEHFICNCPVIDGPRQMYAISASIREALQDDPSSTAVLISFIKNAGLYFKI